VGPAVGLKVDGAAEGVCVGPKVDGTAVGAAVGLLGGVGSQSAVKVSCLAYGKP